jgi:hypothetical protein
VEILGGLSLLASGKNKPGVTPEKYVPKALAWWMALCGKVGVRSVEQMIWAKFPAVCSYCHESPHDHDVCRERKASGRGLDWRELSRRAKENDKKKPRTLAQWQAMFAAIYPVTATEDYPATIGRFTEELGELAEALRISPVAPGYFLSEAADVFAWLMHLQNLIHSKRQLLASERGVALCQWFSESYPQHCRDCGSPVCTCPPILPGTLGRIAHEIPRDEGLFVQGGALLAQDEAIHLFDLGAKSVRIGGAEIETNVALIRDLRGVVDELKSFTVTNRSVAEAHSLDLSRAIEGIEQLVMAQRVTQQSVDALAQAIASLPEGSRTAVVNFLSGIGSSAWATALIEGVKGLIGG